MALVMQRLTELRARVATAYALAERGDHRGAEAEARAALEIQPDDPVALGALGEALSAQDRFAEAGTAFARAYRRDPATIAWARSAVGAYRRANLLTEALPFARAATAAGVDPSDDVTLAQILALLDLLGPAVMVMRTAAERWPRNAGLLALLAHHLENAASHADAEALARRAVELDPESHAARFALGRALGSLGRDEESAAELRRAWDLDHGVEEVGRLAAETYARLGDRVAARRILAEIAATFDAAWAHDYLAALCTLDGELAEALGHAERAVELAPDDAGRWLTLACAHSNLEHPDDARAALREVLARPPVNDDARSLAEALGLTG
jgi:tetratricopeptide (TPR) repeat protein